MASSIRDFSKDIVEVEKMKMQVTTNITKSLIASEE